MKKYNNSLLTKQKIKEAYAELSKEKKDIFKITVKDILDKADISKSTFYYHYPDVFSIQQELEDELIGLLNDLLEKHRHNGVLDYQTFIHQVIIHMKDNEKLYHNLIHLGLSSNYVEKLKNLFYLTLEDDKDIIPLFRNEKEKTLEIDFIVNGTIYMFVDYYSNKINQSLDEIEQTLLLMIETIRKISDL